MLPLLFKVKSRFTCLLYDLHLLITYQMLELVLRNIMYKLQSKSLFNKHYIMYGSLR